MNHYFPLVLRWFIAFFIWQINENHERKALQLLDRIHTGADIDWAISLREQRGRHALNIVHA